MSIKDAFDQFKLCVAGLEYSPDTLALDRALGEASNMLYDIRKEIDLEWVRARAARRKEPPRAVDILMSFSDREIAEALAVVRGHKGVSDENR